jgi:hypothetical protein
VVLCTGRLSPATLPFLRELDLSAGFAVCSNGAVLIDAATGRIVEQVVFDLLDPIAMLRERLPGAIFVAENPGVGVRATGRVHDADMHYGEREFVDIDELAVTATTRLAVHWPRHSGQELAAVLAGVDLGGVRFCCYSGEPLADLTATGVSKAAMLELLRVELGLQQPRPWPSVTASTTWRCWPGQLTALPWVSHPQRCWLQPTRSVLRPQTMVLPSPCPSGSRRPCHRNQRRARCNAIVVPSL